MNRKLLAPTVLHADDWIVVVNKPAGVPSVPGRGEAPALVEVIAARGLVERPEELRIVHRLDRGASGVMVLARSLEAQRRLTELFFQRQVEKVYLALVRGWVPGDGEVDLPLGVDRDRRRVVVDKRSGKPSLTAYRVLERFAGHSLLECRPKTGRLHQIRVHLSKIGFPLSVDRSYGGGQRLLLSNYKPDYRPNRRGDERPLIARLTLHAARISFDHPGGTGRATYEAPLPKDFQATLKQLRRVGHVST